MKIASLSQLKPMKPAIIESVSKNMSDGGMSKHLCEMGIIKGNPIIITNKVDKNTVIIRVGNGGSSMAVGKNAINKIKVAAQDEFIYDASRGKVKESLLTRLKDWFAGFSL